ncbi:MAG: aldo/keto reductase [Pseudomonadota bacterium]|nr:aldo/keto reductase [Pseudomonadota bacterium]
MRYNKLGETSIQVSEICLGSMTWGTQNNYAEASAQIDLAIAWGVNFIDTAELYPTTPLSAETQGQTEAIIGKYMNERKCRHNLVLATKVAGSGVSHIRNGERINPSTITKALEESLTRLKTDYIDLYQLHWPNRGHYHFRKSWHYNPAPIDRSAHDQEVAEILDALQKHVAAGKIRNIGLSNETAWGTSAFLGMSESKTLPRIVSIQNEYSLICRWFDLDLAELSLNEKVGLLAYSPLAAGILTGKYLNRKVPEGSRATIKPGLDGRLTEHLNQPVQSYVKLARSLEIAPEQMALSFCLSRPFMTSVIIGATTQDQLESALGSTKVKLNNYALKEIQNIYRQYPAPM